MTPREERVVGMLLDGIPKKDIAYKLHITEITVDVILHRLYKKSNAKNLIDFVRKQGWLKVSFRFYKSVRINELGA